MAPPSIKKYHIVLAITMAVSCFSSFIYAEAKKGGFSVGLINRDSPNSPFYNPQETPAQRMANAFHRSFNRVNHFYPTRAEVSPNSPRSTVINDAGEYLMQLSIGTPPFEIKAIADTGSDLIWTQCKPCSSCFKQEDAIFNPKSSKTYRNLPCDSKQCTSLSPSCSGEDDCQYEYSYGDNSYTNGNLAADTVTLDSTTGRSVSFPKIALGCGHDNGGTFNEKTSGIVGLGGGPLSLIRQLGSSIDEKFSYCLIPLTSTENTSTLSFGSKAVLSGSGVVSTPIVAGEVETFYYLTLEAVSVGKKKIPFSSSSGAPSRGGEGNIIIDSGTTLTLVSQSFFSSLSTAVKAVVDGEPIEGPGDLSDLLCYSSNSDLKVPTITAHFKGADLKLNSDSLFLEVEEGYTCFTFAPFSSDTPIYGNLAQTNFLVSYDLDKMTVSFKPTDCSTV